MDNLTMYKISIIYLKKLREEELLTDEEFELTKIELGKTYNIDYITA